MLENITNLAFAGISTAYAVINRGTLESELKPGIRTYLKSQFPKIGKVYEKISPIIEHFMYGYTATALGYACQESEPVIEFMLNQHPNSPVESYGLIIAGGATALDFGWELGQNIERKKFQPTQFLGTCAGALTGIAINNLEGILK